MAAKKKSKARKSRQDAYVNTLTGIGDWTQDKVYGGTQGAMSFAVPLISNREAEDRWRASDLGGRIVECVPSEMLREWFELKIQPTEDEEAGGGIGEDGEPIEEEETDPGIEPAESDLPTEEQPLVEDPAKEEASPEEPKEEEKPEEKLDFFPGQKPNGKNPKVDPKQMAEAGMPVIVPKEPPKAIEPQGVEAAEINEKLAAKFDQLEARSALWLALCYERCYGGGALLLGIDDGQKWEKPVDEKRVKAVNFITPFTGGKDGEVTAWSYYTNMQEARFGMPEYYMVRNLGMPMGTGNPIQGMPSEPPKEFINQFICHESRLIVFDGCPASRQVRHNNLGWGDSIFTRVDEVLSYYNQTWGGIANLMSDFAQAYLKIPGLSAALAGRNKASQGNPITGRARLIQQSRSVARMLFIDSEEEFDRKVASLSGVAELLQQFALRLAAAADMPVTLLMGQSPSGMNATGESDIRFFYDRVAAAQERRLAPQIRRLIKLILLSKEGPTKGKEPEQWSLSFNPLYQMSDTEKAAMRKTVAETDAIYIDKQVLTPEEVAASAFGGSEYSTERVIDFAGRQQVAAQEEKLAAERMAAMPEAMKKQAGVKNGTSGNGKADPALATIAAEGAKEEEDPKAAATGFDPS